jgi:CheY-like chemotaxis protein
VGFELDLSLPAADAMRPSIRLDGLRVIVADDEEDARQLLQRVLEVAGAEVVPCSSGTEALTALEQRRADQPLMLVSDIQMPDMNGLALIREVRSRPELASIPALAFTAFAHDGIREEALVSGYQACMLKPIDPFGLIAVIAELSGQTDATP